MIRSTTTYILLVGVYGFAFLVAAASRIFPHRRWAPKGKIMVVGTFHNPNWYLSHITPLSLSGVKELIVITDSDQIPLEGVSFSCWPRWMSRLFGRTWARAIWMMVTAFRNRPDLYMGYHLGPGACTALIVGRLMRRPTCSILIVLLRL